MPADLAAAAGEGIARADAVSRTAGTHAEVIRAAAQDAFVAAWQDAMWVGVAVMAVLVVVVLVRGPEITPTTPTDDGAADSTGPAGPGDGRRASHQESSPVRGPSRRSG